MKGYWAEEWRSRPSDTLWGIRLRGCSPETEEMMVSLRKASIIPPSKIDSSVNKRQKKDKLHALRWLNKCSIPSHHPWHGSWITDVCDYHTRGRTVRKDTTQRISLLAREKKNSLLHSREPCKGLEKWNHIWKLSSILFLQARKLEVYRGRRSSCISWKMILE